MSTLSRVTVDVNGAHYEREVEPRLLLSDFLRHELGLTGTHVGCEHGVCGACTVLLDGEAVRSCLLFAVQVEGRSLRTIEGLAAEVVVKDSSGAAGAASAPELHPLQAAFHEAHALQCGFCTPGILMSLVPFLEENPAPTRDEIRLALTGNLCRCTGYQKIVDAVELAASGVMGITPSLARFRRRGRRGRVARTERRPQLSALTMATRYLGAPVLRNEDPRLLTGRALFVDDVAPHGLLHAAFVRSPFAHARLRAVDVEAARRRPGVHAVLTAEDLGAYWRPGPLLVPPPPIDGLVFHARTQVPLARGKVRHVGEPVAVIVADSRYLAEDAAADVILDAEPLDAAVDLEAALLPGAPRVHDDLDSNVAAHAVQRKGDYAAARRARRTGSRAASATTAAARRRWRTAAWWRPGTRAPSSSRCGTRRRRRSRSATAWRRCSGSRRARCA